MELMNKIKKAWYQHQFKKAMTVNHVDIPLLKKCLSYGVDLNQSVNGKTVLHLCARKQNLEKINFLLDANVDANVQNEQGDTPIHNFCDGYFVGLHLIREEERNAFVSTLIRLIEKTKTAHLNRQNSEGDILFSQNFFGSGMGHLCFSEIIPALKKKNFDFNLTDKENHTLLFHALCEECLSEKFMARREIRKDDLYNLISQSTALESVCNIIDAGARFSSEEVFLGLGHPLDYASVDFCKNPDFIKKLCDVVPTDYQDKNGNNLLHFYAGIYDLYVCDIEIDKETASVVFNHLLEKYEIDAQNHQGETPLMVAIRQGSRSQMRSGDLPWMPHEEYDEYREFQIKQLLKAGADVTIKNNAGKNALDCALEVKNPHLATYLFKNYEVFQTQENFHRINSQRKESDLPMLQTVRVSKNTLPILANKALQEAHERAE